MQTVFDHDVMENLMKTWEAGSEPLAASQTIAVKIANGLPQCNQSTQVWLWLNGKYKDLLAKLEEACPMCHWDGQMSQMHALHAH